MRFIGESLHGFLDYAVAATLITAPFILGFAQYGPIAQWMSVIAGVALLVYSLMTDYSLSARSVLPFGLHLAIDFAAGVAFVVAPFLFGFGGIAASFYVVMGAAVIAVVFLTNPHVSKEAVA